MDRSEINRALAKAMAFKACGKDADADAWAGELIRLLDCAGILNDNLRPLGVVASARSLMDARR